MKRIFIAFLAAIYSPMAFAAIGGRPVLVRPWEVFTHCSDQPGSQFVVARLQPDQEPLPFIVPNLSLQDHFSRLGNEDRIRFAERMEDAAVVMSRRGHDRFDIFYRRDAHSAYFLPHDVIESPATAHEIAGNILIAVPTRRPNEKALSLRYLDLTQNMVRRLKKLIADNNGLLDWDTLSRLESPRRRR